MNKIYDPFFRASNTKNYEGYGIGLPLARNIVRIHHGELIVTSHENQGTTVQLRFLIFIVHKMRKNKNNLVYMAL
jgi:signal transduction histidine kinase